MHTVTVIQVFIFLLILLEFPTLIHSFPQQTSDIDIDISQQSSSGSNPSCVDAAFAYLSCPSPGRCYYSDRTGTPACCPAGQNCQTGSETETGSADSSSPASAPASDSSSGGENSSSPRESGGGSGDGDVDDSSNDAGSPNTDGGSYVGPGAENVLVFMNNSAHARGLEGGSGIGRIALKLVWGWVLMLNALGM